MQNITDTERLILANQCEILSALKDDEDYALMAETLTKGHKWLYDQYLDTLRENLSEEKARHVLTILEIFDSLQSSYQALADKTDIDEEVLNFPGFDGNNEGELLSFANGLIKHDRFCSVLGDKARNSHMMTTDMYRRMIERWNELGSPRGRFNKETIQEILGARVHPDSRE